MLFLAEIHHQLLVNDPAEVVPLYFPAVTPGICRLVISLFIVYPLSYVHRELIHGKSKPYQLSYFLFNGIAIIYYVLGARGTLHCICNVLMVWMLKKLLGPSDRMVLLTAISTMVYLVVGYIWNTNAEVYDVLWTTPHSIHTMKLIGLAFDYRDGNTNKPEELTEDMRRHAVKDFSLFELLSFNFTFTGGLTGPQMSFVRFRAFCEGRVKFDTDSRGRPDSVGEAVQRCLAGCIFLVIYLVGGLLFNRETLLHKTFNDQNVVYRVYYICGFGVLALTKYIGCWTVMEGGCILLGLSYDPHHKGNKWGAMKSVNIRKMYLGYTGKAFIDNFNLTTKYWFIRYLFKRTLTWGKWASMAYTYLFIVLWHGVLPGYWMAFLFEIPVITAEKQLIVFLKHHLGSYEEWNWPAQRFCDIFSRVARVMALGYGIQPFILLDWGDIVQVYNGFYWIFHIAVFLWLLSYHFLIRHTLPKTAAISKVKPVRTEEARNRTEMKDPKEPKTANSDIIVTKKVY